MTKIKSNDPVILKIREFIDLVNKSGVIVSGAYLFGSYAKGQAKPHSDIDICVTSPSLGRDYLAEMVKLRQLALKVDSRLEPVPFNDRDISDPYNSLAVEILRHGLDLFPSPIA